jgi:hypothetical protein
MKGISQLDCVRGVTILLVLICHYFASKVATDPKSFVSFSSRALGLTWSGIELFFVLSGFLITGILIDHRNTSNISAFFIYEESSHFAALFSSLGALPLRVYCCSPAKEAKARDYFCDFFNGWNVARETRRSHPPQA